jgi:superfamily II DNA or RNA helicase
VQEASYEPPFVNGTILWSNRPLRTSVRILPDGSAENCCPCRDSTERGIVCAHVVALCLELIRRAHDPEGESRRQAELRRAARLSKVSEGAYVKRARTGTPGTLSAQVQLALARDWQSALREGRIPVSCQLLCDGELIPVDGVRPETCVGLSQRDESILFVLEDIGEGPARSRLEVTPADFLSLLHLHQGHRIEVEDGAAVTVAAARLTSYLHLDLDRENGELILNVHTEIPFRRPAETPLYLIAGRSGWVFAGGHFWPLDQVLPEPLRPVYAGPAIIPRQAVPKFIRDELPTLAGFMRVESDLTADLFAIEPAVPRFRLVVRGSPASLAAVLHAEYNGITLAAGRSDPAGQFAIPDPSDLLRYTVRNPAAEADALRALAPFGFKGEAGDALAPIVGCREVLNFLGSQMPALRRMGWRVEVEGRIGAFLESTDFATPVVQIRYPNDGSNWFEVGFDFEGPQGERFSPAEIHRALLKGEAFLTHQQRTVLLDASAINSMTAVFRDCASEEGSQAGVFRMPLIYASYVKASLDALDGVDVEAAPAWRTVAEQQARQVALEPVDLPPALDGILRPYQREGVRWLRFLEANAFGGILADEMGLGKTLQALAWLQMERCHPAAGGKPALVVCPTSLVGNWAEEAQRFVPALRVLTIAGADRHSKWDEVDAANLVITSYALLRRDVEHYVDREFAVVILDEAQHIKNRSTLNALTAKELKACSRIVLTGTPIENSVSDVWSIMDFLMPGYLGSHENFHRTCELAIAQGGPEGEEAQRRLRRKLQPFLMRRLKVDVARDLPPRIEKIAACPLSADQKAVYKTLLESSRNRLTDLVARQGFQRSRMEVLRTLLRLRQACCHLELLPMPDLRSEAPSAKMDLFFELLDEALDGGHRVLVFSQFVSMLSILRRELDRRQIPFCYLDGATQDRMAVVHEFNSNRAIPLFLISLKAGGTGLNLTGADMVIHYDPWWNPAVEDQATDRAHRIGQKRTVYSVKLITQGTVEEKVLAMQRQKKAVIDATLAPSESFFNQMSWNDILGLLTL